MIGLSARVRPQAGSFAPLPSNRGLPLLADLRWDGFTAALEGAHTEQLVVIGGVERLPTRTVPREVSAICAGDGAYLDVPRGLATCHALTHRLGIDASRLEHRLSEGNTGGNVAVIRALLDELQLSPEEVCICTNFYHLPRSTMDLHAAGLGGLATVPAEAFLLAALGDREACEQRLLDAFGKGPLALRAVAEIRGMADKLNGAYTPLAR